MSEITMSPCPFCGNQDIELYDNGTVTYAICRWCNMIGPEAVRNKKEAAENWNNLPRRLRLEKKDCAPEEPGNYWFRHPDWNAGAPFIVECYHSPNPPEFTGERIVNLAGREYHVDYDDAKFFEGGEWAGPIKMPENIE